MVGSQLLECVDQRLRECDPEFRNHYFGGKKIILLGDFYQLPAIPNSSMDK
jgi:hypothetical protein